jgi:uncharacterized protein (TIGR02246 family)
MGRRNQVEDEYLAAAKAVQAAWSDAFEKRDIDRLVALYAPDATFWGSTNDLHTDADGVRSYFADLSPTYKRSRYEAPHVLRLAPDVLAASGYVVFVREVDGKDVQLPYRMTHVLVRREGAWKIAIHHASPQPS